GLRSSRAWPGLPAKRCGWTAIPGRPPPRPPGDRPAARARPAAPAPPAATPPWRRGGLGMSGGAEVRGAFDYLVGAEQHDVGRPNSERLGGLHIEHRFVFGRRLHGKIGRLFTLEDAVDVAGGLPELVEEIRPIGDQTAGSDVGAFNI